MLSECAEKQLGASVARDRLLILTKEFLPELDHVTRPGSANPELAISTSPGGEVEVNVQGNRRMLIRGQDLPIEGVPLLDAGIRGRGQHAQCAPVSPSVSSSSQFNVPGENNENEKSYPQGKGRRGAQYLSRSARTCFPPQFPRSPLPGSFVILYVLWRSSNDGGLGGGGAGSGAPVTGSIALLSGRRHPARYIGMDQRPWQNRELQ